MLMQAAAEALLFTWCFDRYFLLTCLRLGDFEKKRPTPWFKDALQCRSLNGRFACVLCRRESERWDSCSWCGGVSSPSAKKWALLHFLSQNIWVTVSDIRRRTWVSEKSPQLIQPVIVALMRASDVLGQIISFASSRPRSPQSTISYPPVGQKQNAPLYRSSRTRRSKRIDRHSVFKTSVL